MAHLKLRGLILRLVNVKDYDRYITILTRDAGLISVFARGIRRGKNKLAARCQLFTFGDFQIFSYKGRYSLDDAEIVYSFRNLQSDLLRLSAASQLAALVIDHVHEKEEAPPFYELLVRACYELDRGKKDPYMLTWLAQMKMMNFMGYQPDLELPGSAAGQKPSQNETFYFDYRRAQLLTPREGQKALKDPRSPVSPVSGPLLSLLRYLEHCPIERTFSVRSDPGTVNELGQFTLRYLAEHLEKSYDTFSAFKDFALPPKDPSAREDSPPPQ